MLKLKIGWHHPRGSVIDAANPAHLLTSEEIRGALYVSYGRLSHVLFHVAALTVLGIASINIATQSGGNHQDSSLAPSICALLLALLSEWCILYARKLTTISIHLLPLGHPFPSLDGSPKPEPANELVTWLRTRARGPDQADKFHFHVAVRETEPNVSARLRRYSKIAGNRLTMTSEEYEEPLSYFRAQSFPTTATIRLARVLEKYSEEKSDIWPVARLAISRILYQRNQKSSYKRSPEETQTKPEIKGAHYYLAFKQNVMPICYWLLLLSLALCLPLFPVAQSDLLRKHIYAAIIVLVFIWTIWTYRYNRDQVKRWRAWLSETSVRPLGMLPLYLMIPNNPQSSRWEELDEADFRVPLDEFLLEASTALQLIHSTFAALAVTFAGLLK